MPDEIYITHLNSKYILQISENNFFFNLLMQDVLRTNEILQIDLRF